MVDNSPEFISPAQKDNARSSSEFEVKSGGHIPRRKDHHNAPDSVWRGEKGYAKRMDALERQNAFIEKEAADTPQQEYGEISMVNATSNNENIPLTEKESLAKIREHLSDSYPSWTNDREAIRDEIRVHKETFGKGRDARKAQKNEEKRLETLRDEIAVLADNPPVQKDNQRRNDFQEKPNGGITRRKDRHTGKNYTAKRGIQRYPGQFEIYHGLDKKAVVSAKNTQAEISEGMEVYDKAREQDLPFYETWDGWDKFSPEKAQHAQHAMRRLIWKQAQLVQPTEELMWIREKTKATHPADMGEYARLHDTINGYKEQLAKQQLAIARAIDTVRTAIYANPDHDTKDLVDVAMDIAGGRNTRFGGEIADRFQDVLDEYAIKHKVVDKIYTDYKQVPSGDAKLFRLCFGSLPKGKVIVEKGPMTLHFQIDDADDYVTAHSFGSVWDQNSITEEQRKEILLSGGAALRNVAEFSLDGTVVIENGMHKSTLDERRKLRVHEEQHQFDRIFNPLIAHISEKAALRRGITRSKNTPRSLVVNVVTEWMRVKRREFGIDTAARTEILAYLREGMRPDDIYWTLTTSPLYDYAKDFQTLETQNALFEEFQDIVALYRGELPGLPKALDIHSWDIRDGVTNVFTIEYKKDLRRRVDALKELEYIKGYSRDDIIALLYSQPVDKWARLARRLPAKDELEKVAHALPPQVQRQLLVPMGEYIGEDTQEKAIEQTRKFEREYEKRLIEENLDELLAQGEIDKEEWAREKKSLEEISW